MLPKPNRLPSFEIRNVLRRGKRIANASMQVVFLPNQINVSRFAFVVSTNIDKRATKRNRIKRLMRETVHAVLPQIRRTIDAILIARSTEEPEIARSVDELFHKAEFL